MNIPTERIRHITELGFLSAGQGHQQEATDIIEGLKAMRPEATTPYMIEVFMMMGNNQYQQASTLLQEKALKIDPNDDILKGFLALTLTKQGLASQAEQYLAQAKSSEHTLAVQLADEVEKMN